MSENRLLIRTLESPKEEDRCTQVDTIMFLDSEHHIP